MPFSHVDKQRGAALIISLLLLTTLTLIGLTTARTTRMQTIMAGNTRESSIAFEAAEAALREAELLIENSVSIAAFDGTNAGLFNSDFDADADVLYYFKDTTWTDGNSREYGDTDGTSEFPEVEADPRYIIKYLGDVINVTAQKNSITIGGYAERSAAQTISMFRITARGTGRNDSSRVLLQSYYGKIY